MTNGTRAPVAVDSVARTPSSWTDAARLVATRSTVTTVDALLEKPYSREHESEADHVGLLLASRACFDPYHAQYLFHQLAKDRKAGKMPEEGTVFNTHPLDRDRQKAVRSQLDEAMDEHARCGCPAVDRRRRQKFDRQLKLRQRSRHLSCEHRRTSKLELADAKPAAG